MPRRRPDRDVSAHRAGEAGRVRWVTSGVGLVAVTWVPAVAWLAISEWAWAAMMIGVAMGLRDRPRGPLKTA
jgi:hypothetical protein